MALFRFPALGASPSLPSPRKNCSPPISVTALKTPPAQAPPPPLCGPPPLIRHSSAPPLPSCPVSRFPALRFPAPFASPLPASVPCLPTLPTLRRRSAAPPLPRRAVVSSFRIPVDLPPRRPAAPLLSLQQNLSSKTASGMYGVGVSSSGAEGLHHHARVL